MFAQEIGAAVLGRIRALRHVGAIKAEAAVIQKCLILKIFPENYVSHGVRKGAVRSGTDGNPLGVQGQYRVIFPRINDNDGNSGGLRFLQIEQCAAVKFCLRRVMAPENN